VCVCVCVCESRHDKPSLGILVPEKSSICTIHVDAQTRSLTSTSSSLLRKSPNRSNQGFISNPRLGRSRVSSDLISKSPGRSHAVAHTLSLTRCRSHAVAHTLWRFDLLQQREETRRSGLLQLAHEHGRNFERVPLLIQNQITDVLVPIVFEHLQNSSLFFRRERLSQGRAHVIDQGFDG
jgi:hypothetical protein